MPDCRTIFLASPHLAGLEQVLRDMAGVFMVEVLSGEIMFPCSLQALYVLHRQEDLDRFLGNGGARDAVLVMSRLADSLGSATKVVLE